MNWTLLVAGLIVTLSPLPLVCFFILLSSQRGLAKGASFIVGWVASLVIIIVATLLVTGGRPPRPASTPGRVVSLLFLFIGLGLLAVARRQWQKYRAGAPVSEGQAKLLGRLDTMPLWSAGTLGVLIQPWPFVAAGAASVSEIDLRSPSAWISIALYVVFATSTLLCAEIYVMVNKERAVRQLTATRRWLEARQRLLLFTLALVFGIVLGFKGFLQLL